VRAFRRTFREGGTNGGFGIWWFCPPNPALAGNACRWPASFKIISFFISTSKIIADKG